MLRRFMSYYRPYKRLFILDFSCAIAAALLSWPFHSPLTGWSINCFRLAIGP